MSFVQSQIAIAATMNKIKTDIVDYLSTLGYSNSASVKPGLFMTLHLTNKYAYGVPERGFFINLTEIKELDDAYGMRDISASVFMSDKDDSANVVSKDITSNVKFEGDFTAYVCAVARQMIIEHQQIQFVLCTSVISTIEFDGKHPLDKDELKEVVTSSLKNKFGAELIDHPLEELEFTKLNAVEILLNSNAQFTLAAENIDEHGRYKSLLLAIDSIFTFWNSVKSTWSRLLTRNEVQFTDEHLDSQIEFMRSAIHHAFGDNPKANKIIVRIHDNLSYEIIV